MIVLYPFVVVVGLLCEAAVLVLGSMLHTTLGLNLGNALAIGVLGLPGFLLLLLVQWVL